MTMTTEALQKAEREFIPMALLRAAQTQISQGSNWFVIPLEIISKEVGLTREEILQPWRGRNVVSEGDFTMLYNPKNESVHFTRIHALPESSHPEVEVQPVQKPDPSMSAEQLTAIAKQEWASDKRLHREFTGEDAFVAFRQAEIRGRVHIIGKRKVH